MADKVIDLGGHKDWRIPDGMGFNLTWSRRRGILPVDPPSQRPLCRVCGKAKAQSGRELCWPCRKKE